MSWTIDLYSAAMVLKLLPRSDSLQIFNLSKTTTESCEIRTNREYSTRSLTSNRMFIMTCGGVAWRGVAWRSVRVAMRSLGKVRLVLLLQT